MSAIFDFTAKLTRMADPATWERYKRACAVATQDALLSTYDAETDPYGTAWKQVKPHFGHKRILVDSDGPGSLRGSFRWELIGAGFKIQVRDWKAGYHQHGTGRMVARPFLPKRGMPPKVLRALRATTKAVFK